MLIRTGLFAAYVVCAVNAFPPAAAYAATTLPKCLYVSSYHKGYSWSDGIESGLRNGLSGHCEIRQLNMDTKLKKSAQEKVQAATAVVEVIREWNPDVVITSDDNAAKYVIAPHFRNVELPFVFCGVNWTVEEYGFPYTNVTGIVEIAPIKPLLQQAFEITGGRKALYLGEDTLSEIKNFQRVSQVAKLLDLTIEKKLTNDFNEWLNAYLDTGPYDFIVLGSNSAIANWDATLAVDQAQQAGTPLSVTNHDWMMPVATLGYTKISSEQGEWAAAAAIQILKGVPPGDIPLAANTLWDLWVNETLLEVSGIELSQTLLRKAKKLPIETASASNN